MVSQKQNVEVLKCVSAYWWLGDQVVGWLVKCKNVEVRSAFRRLVGNALYAFRVEMLKYEKIHRHFNLIK